jgi:glucose/arabinose dehydrogenase
MLQMKAIGLLGLLASSFVNAAAFAGVPTLYGPGQTAGAYDGTLRLTAFATGLNYPTAMQEYGPAGNSGILVGTTMGGPFYSSSSTGQLLLLKDTNHDGVADQTFDLTPAGGLPGSITAVQQAGNLVFVTSSVGTASPVINVLRDGATPTSPLISVGAITLNFPSGWEHESYALAARPTPGQAGKFDLLFNVGAQFNDVAATNTLTATTGGNVSGFTNITLQPESIYKMTVTDTGSGALVTSPAQIAKGLRNAAGIAFQPGTGDLYFDDNGMDGTVANGHPDDIYGNAAYSMDTLHKISAANIGASVPDYGFATNFVENNSAKTVHGNPSYVGVFAPLNGSILEESEGPNQIAFAPSSFPTGLNNGVFIGFHGQFDQTGNPDPNTGQGNEEHPVVFWDAATSDYWHFIDNANADVTMGHLDGLLSTSDSLYLADLASGSLFGGPTNTGTIYQIQSVPEPTIARLLPLIGAMVLGARWRSRRPSV